MKQVCEVCHEPKVEWRIRGNSDRIVCDPCWEKMRCSHCDLMSNVSCKDCGQRACIFCAMHGVHEQESHKSINVTGV